MEIQGLLLPRGFVSCIERGVLRRKQGSWQLRKPFDAYGNPLETELSTVYESIEQIERESDRLSLDFPADIDDSPDPFCAIPGFIPYITDFRQILAFAASADGAPFCFDYRDGMEPTIIWWADAYWHRIAPSFSEFLGLFTIDKTPDIDLIQAG
ncbi:MAG: SMI1/KNR4 family protein [Azonexus sp.]|nr:SMI1/KNR4 family protein [Azonexus sp.]